MKPPLILAAARGLNFRQAAGRVCWMGGLAASLILGGSLRAVVPEPDNVVYGQITLGGVPVTARDSQVVVEARKTPAGPAVARYRMGENPAYADAYSLEIPLEAFFPVANPDASRVGSLLYLVVLDSSGVRDTRTVSIAQRGQLLRVDFSEPDTDGDRMSDGWETRYFGSATGGNPTVDLDGDGRNNLQEFVDGTNPLVADGRHPADRSPADNLLSIEESEAYANAWLQGANWPGQSTNIPIAYVSRAAALALSGRAYAFTNVPPTNAPLWWVNLPYAGPRPRGAQVASSGSLPASVAPGALLAVVLQVVPTNTVVAFAVQDRPPSGWTNVFNISHGGSFDPVQRLVKWGPFYDQGARDLSYEVLSPANAAGASSFAGIASFDGDDWAIAGQRTVQVGSGSTEGWEIGGGGAPDGGFLMRGAPNTGYLIEASTNLVHWQSLINVTTGSDGTYRFQPPEIEWYSQRFFRTRRAP